MEFRGPYPADHEPITLDHIVHVLQSHHWECVFELDAPRRIYDRLKHHSKAYWLNYRGPDYTEYWFEQSRRFDLFKQAFIQSQIFCAHEGVDSRAREVSLRTLQAVTRIRAVGTSNWRQLAEYTLTA